MVHMEPEDPREWEVTINRRKCPLVYYPANYVGCQMLPSGCRCSLDNCPLKTKRKINLSIDQALNEGNGVYKP